jgi:hypothetical protein
MKLDRAAKTIYVYDEYLKSGALINESCEYIRRITGNAPIEWTVCDPSLNKRNSQTPFTDMMEFARNGISCIPADNRDRGYDVTKMFLKKNHLIISPKCKNLIYQLRNVQRDQEEGEDLLDCLRYGVLRIHDHIQGMNIYEIEAKERPRIIEHSKELNINDFIKPREQELTSWVYEEAVSE